MYENGGGEIRVEAGFDLTWNPDLSITVVSTVKLFEGTSEDTDDLDGEGGNIVTVGKDASNVPMHVFVRNNDEDDDDHVILDILISNFVDL